MAVNTICMRLMIEDHSVYLFLILTTRLIHSGSVAVWIHGPTRNGTLMLGEHSASTT